MSALFNRVNWGRGLRGPSPVRDDEPLEVLADELLDQLRPVHPEHRRVDREPLGRFEREMDGRLHLLAARTPGRFDGRTLRRLGVHRLRGKEFHGKAINAGNADIYLRFLRYFVNAAAGVSDQADLHPIVTVDAEAQYIGGNTRWLFEQVTGALKNLGLENEDHLVAEFSRQILWLYLHWKKVPTPRFRNLLVLLFDNKHRYAQKFKVERLVVNEKLIAPLSGELGKTMTSFANTVLEPRLPIPRISRFDFQWSPSEFGLQAADLFSNLVHSALRSSSSGAAPFADSERG